MLRRRSLLAGAALTPLARPAIGGTAQTLNFVPQATLTSIDPVWSSAMVVRNLGLMVFETLYGRDERMNPRPQMLDGDLMEDGGRRWTLHLRDNQRFHDGEPVLARDCIASLRRWMKRDPGGASLEVRLDEITARDDRTIVLRLNKPFPHLPELLSKFVIPAVIMPERIARTDPFKQIQEAIGSGPFRFVAGEHVLGSRAVFAKNEAYVPRQDPPSFTAGGRHVMLDRVVWHMIPDGGTAVNALMTGEIDWIEIPLPDLIGGLRTTKGIRTGQLDAYGQIMALRVNHLADPTSNVWMRRAIMASIDQREAMTAIMGGDPDNWRVPMGFMATGKQEIDEAGLDNVRAASRRRRSRRCSTRPATAASGWCCCTPPSTPSTTRPA
jgi:peptide/nickel transport system substrate-binding protein